MNDFLKKVLWFTLVPTIALLLMDVFISKKLQATKFFPAENEVWNDIYNGKINANIAIYGSSRAWVHYDPQIIEEITGRSAYNFGEDGSNIMLQYVRHKQYLKHNIKPKKVILSVDMWTIRENVNTYPTQRFYPYMLFKNDVLNLLKKENIEFNTALFYTPMLRFVKSKHSMQHLFKSLNDSTVIALGKYPVQLNKYGNVRNKGYRGMELTFNEDDYARQSKELKDYAVKVDPALVTVFGNFLLELRMQDIEVVMIYPPELKPGQSIVKNRNQIIRIFDSIAKVNQIPFIDYFDSLISYDKKLFYNVQHLNLEGAEKISNSVANFILKAH